jgi:N-methylhydantoinase A
MKRVGIDIGGTFTDIVTFDERTGSVTRAKTLSTPDAPEQGFNDALQLVEADVGDMRALIHGTTIVTNLILERKGARVALITTTGFRDVLEIMRATRPMPYDLFWRKPLPVIPRSLRFEVDERVNAFGEIVRPLERAAVAEVIEHVLAQDVEAVAVCLMHSYTNDVHERQIEAILRERRPDLPISISSRICREIREYERTNTTAINAYAMPRVRRYVAALERQFTGSSIINYISSEGGLQPGRETSDRPISLCLSGPAGGVLGSAFLGQLSGRRNLITVDMGGTSLDVAVIRDGRIELKNTFEVEWGVPVKTPTIDIKTIGAGGGSIVWVDEGGALRVGPHSAGADPGPACYGRGGTDCTVTDANLVLGLINPDGLLGGKLKLDRRCAEAAVRRVAERFDTAVPETAEGIYRVVNANMAAAIRQMTVEKGIDPRDFALVPFGGAGGQHAAALAREVGIRKIIVPNLPSVFSAFGMVSAPVKISRSQTVMRPVSEIRGATELFSTLAGQVRDAVQASRIKSGYALEHSLDMRYVKQSHEVNVTVQSDWSVERIIKAFEARHRELYGTSLGHEIVVVTARLTALTSLPPMRLPEFPAKRGAKPRLLRHATIVGVHRKVQVYDRESLERGMRLAGPCLVEETDTCLCIPDKAVATIDKHRNIVVVP